VIPYPTWLSSGDNAWQMTAATLVGLMSIPALAVLYGGLVQKKWAMNTTLMVFVTFCLVLITWVLWAYKMGFGTPLVHFGSVNVLGDPRTILGANALEGQASIPLVDSAMPGYAVSKTGEILNSGFRLPGASIEYFQFVFAAITPILFIGSVLGRVSFKAWMVFVPLWITFAYAVNAFLLWGGGYWASKGALDFSGGYVIHLAAGVSGFVSAAVIGPRLKRDREKAIPNNLLFVAVGAGILWLGWNGFNGGDPYFAGANAGAAVVNTNLATAVAMMVWILMDMFLTTEKKPTFLGGLNGMICGLVGITPAAGYVNGLGAIIIGVLCSAVVWVGWMYLPKYVWPFNKVDDALGVIYTHGIAGLLGGLLVGVLADPNVIEYPAAPGGAAFSGAGWLWGHHPHQVLVQLLAALTIIVWDGVVTFLIWMFIKYVLRMKLRFSDAELEIGDVAVHGEEAYPQEEVFSTRLSVTAEAEASPTTEEPVAQTKQ
jgi:Amt family ammonium transporter